MQNLPQPLCLSLKLLSQEILVDATASLNNLPLLELELTAETVTADQLQSAMRHVSAATQLTRLFIQIRDIADVQAPHSIAVCEHLRPLSDLRSLFVSVGSQWYLGKRNVEHLSALVGLTSLDLRWDSCGPYLNPTLVCLLAVTLTNLRVLAMNDLPTPHLVYNRCIDETVLPAIGRLTALRALRLEPLSREVALRGLQLLTDLTGLENLDGFDAAGPGQAPAPGDGSVEWILGHNRALMCLDLWHAFVLMSVPTGIPQ